MEEEITYSTVVFKDGRPPPKAHPEKKEDPTIYPEVEAKGPPTTAPQAAVGAAVGADVGADVGAAVGAAAHSHDHVWAPLLGIIVVLLVASIVTIVGISLTGKNQSADINVLQDDIGHLITELSDLQKENRRLSRVIDNLNWTMGVILTFNSFPVNEFCPEKKCQPCQTNWLLFQEKCYLFYNQPAPWKEWEAGREYCRDRGADLVVIDSPQEQEFISNNTEFYYDRAHGYWLGLYETEDRNWIWVDGLNDTLRYWIVDELGPTGKYALMIPDRPPTASWDPASQEMENKFICEGEVLIRFSLDSQDSHSNRTKLTNRGSGRPATPVF